MTSSPPSLRRAGLTDAPILAALHAAAATPAWSVTDFAQLLATPSAVGLIAALEGRPAGLLVLSVVAGEAEILTLAVDPVDRRRGVARALLADAASRAKASGASGLLLEVAVDNDPALHLYRTAGFREIGRRPGYYRAGRTTPVDALCLSRPL